jgi:CRISPR-associated protein Cmr2
MSNNKYTVVTIGPIIETFNAARKTRELWGASYLFSYIIKQVVLSLDKNKIILPAYETEDDYKNDFGAGLFPDRIFIEGYVDIVSNYNSVMEKVSNKIATHSRQDKQIVKEYLEKYFRFIQVQFECNDNIIDTGTTLLDSRELESKIIVEDEFVDGSSNPLFKYLFHVNGSFLITDGFGTRRKSFPSLTEIAMKDFEFSNPVLYQELVKKIEASKENEESDIIVEDFIENNKAIKQFHKYVAIVQADGDNVGKIIKRIGNKPEEIKIFSKKLMKFSKLSTEIVDKYGGSPVYMGGDDMLFFAPLVCNKKNILNLIDELNITFNEFFKAEINEISELDKKPSVSFGISLSYYKFPLYQAKNMAFEALFHDIKWVDDKNAVKIKFRKHSGQMHEWFIKKHNSSVWREIVEFVNYGKEDEKFLNSFTHKLRLQNEVLFSKIASSTNKLEFFFKNNYNENYESHKGYYEMINKLISVINQNKKDNESAIDLLYSTLKFTHFLRS